MIPRGPRAIRRPGASGMVSVITSPMPRRARLPDRVINRMVALPSRVWHQGDDAEHALRGVVDPTRSETRTVAATMLDAQGRARWYGAETRARRLAERRNKPTALASSGDGGADRRRGRHRALHSGEALAPVLRRKSGATVPQLSVTWPLWFGLPLAPEGAGRKHDGAAAAIPPFLSQVALRLTAEVLPC